MEKQFLLGVAAVLIAQSLCLMIASKRLKKATARATAEHKAIFRLGQLDMQASACDMLRDMSGRVDGKTRCLLILAADLVGTMEVPVANT